MVDPPYRIKNMMPGMIMIWAGSIATIPSGWTLCDGTMGTPDLRNLFVIGAGDTYDVGDKLIYQSHRHAFTGDGHSHTIPPGSGLMAGTDFALETESDPAIGITNYLGNVHSYYALCYIMKL